MRVFFSDSVFQVKAETSFFKIHKRDWFPCGRQWEEGSSLTTAADSWTDTESEGETHMKDETGDWERWSDNWKGMKMKLWQTVKHIRMKVINFRKSSYKCLNRFSITTCGERRCSSRGSIYRLYFLLSWMIKGSFKHHKTNLKLPRESMMLFC